MQSSEVGRFARRSALGFTAVVLGAVVLGFAVRLDAGPVLRIDRAVAGDLNTVVAPRPWLVTVLEVLTAPGSAVTAWVVLTSLTGALLLRRTLRLALYVAVTGLGAATLSPLLKHLVDRLRPVVATPVASAGGPSFPSGHTLGVTVWVGVVLLVLLPVVAARHRRTTVGLGVAVVVVVGLTRVALGVHFASDVLAGWLVGCGWLLVTATAFRAWRRHEGLAVGPAVDGLAPEVADDLTPPHVADRAPGVVWTTLAQLLVGAVLLLGTLVGLGLLLTSLPPGTGLLRADVGAVAWLAAHRVPWFDPVSAFLAELGNTEVVVACGLVAALVAYRITRRVRPALVVVAALVGEVLVFLAAVGVVDRPRPPVVHLDAMLPPTSSFPSGHTAAAICLYGTVAALVIRHRSPETGEGRTRVPVGLRAPISAPRPRAWWRWVVLAAAVVVVVAVAFARLYRGAHHPTDVLASALFAVPWLLLVLHLVGDEPDGRGTRAATRDERAGSVGGHR